MSVTGFKETAAALKELDRKATKSLGRKALRAGAKVLLAAARTEAPELTGRTRKNIKIRGGRSRAGSLSLSVGVSAKDFSGEAFYASFVLFGHRVGSRKLGDNRRMIPANNFLERAYEASGQNAADTVMEQWVELIEIESSKGNA